MSTIDAGGTFNLIFTDALYSQRFDKVESRQAQTVAARKRLVETPRRTQNDPTIEPSAMTAANATRAPTMPTMMISR
jgi:hypothetical protein